MDCIPPGSSDQGIFQARILEWVSFSRGSSQPSTWTWVCSTAGRFFFLPTEIPPNSLILQGDSSSFVLFFFFFFFFLPFLTISHSVWDLSSVNGDQICTPWSESMASWLLDHEESPQGNSSDITCTPQKVNIWFGRHPLLYACLKILWTEESGALHSLGSQRVWHNWATNTFTFLIWTFYYETSGMFLVAIR